MHKFAMCIVLLALSTFASASAEARPQNADNHLYLSTSSWATSSGAERSDHTLSFLHLSSHGENRFTDLISTAKKYAPKCHHGICTVDTPRFGWLGFGIAESKIPHDNRLANSPHVPPKFMGALRVHFKWFAR